MCFWKLHIALPSSSPLPTFPFFPPFLISADLLIHIIATCLVYCKGTIWWLEFTDNLKEHIFVLLIFFFIFVGFPVNKNTLYQSWYPELTSTHTSHHKICPWVLTKKAEHAYQIGTRWTLTGHQIFHLFLAS